MLALLLIMATSAAEPISVDALVETARSHLGERYLSGGTGGRRGVDCSGLVRAIFSAHGVELPRTSREQARIGQPVRREQIAAGDLLFFTNRVGTRRVQHVALAIDEQHMIHASTVRKKVVLDAFDSPHYRRRFLFARRILPPPETTNVAWNRL